MKRILTRLNVPVLVLAMFLVVSCNLDDKESASKKKQEQPEIKGYQGDDNFTSNNDASQNFFSVTRDKTTKNYTVAIKNLEKDTEWKIYVGTDPNNIDMSRPYMSGIGNASHVIAVPADTKYFFQVVLPDTRQSAVIAERNVPLQGGVNIRDVGGYRTSSGKYVKWGKFYRSAHMSGLNAGDIEYLRTIGLKNIIDLRTPGEISTNPDKYPTPETTWRNISLLPSKIQGNHPEYFVNFHRCMLTDAHSLGLLKDIFAIFQDETNAPVLFHCAGGRDRTGVTGVLLLLALGVEEKSILEDFMLTNATHSTNLVWATEGILATLRNNYESTEYFFENVLDVDLIKFRQMYLE